GTCSESSEQIRSRIMGARERQKDRYQGTAIRFNADLTASDIEKYCHLGAKEEHYIEQIFRSLELSARSYHRILRLSRTIADLDGSDNIQEKHISEAVGYKMAERLWDGLEEM
ncbi:MAG: magnesium chelatase, partial [Lachnospiraceae bacterium]|nr:magnesium chelatase [Candidatus Merdinaster equi]